MARRQAQPIRLEPALEPASGLRGYKTIASSTLVIAQPTSRAVLRTGRVTSDLCDSQHVGPAAPGDSGEGKTGGANVAACARGCVGRHIEHDGSYVAKKRRLRGVV